MRRNYKLIAGTAAVALVAGGGAAFATAELLDSHSSPPAASTAVQVGVNGYGLGGRLGGRGFGGGVGPGSNPGRHFGFGLGPISSGLNAAADYLGISRAQLDSDLASSQNLAAIADAQGKTVDGLITAMLATRVKELENAVAAGQLTASQEQQVEARDTQRMRQLVEGHSPDGFGRHGAGTPPTA